MKRFFDSSSTLLNPSDIVKAFTGYSDGLALPERVVIVFSGGDLRRIVYRTGAVKIDRWSGFRPIYEIPEHNTIITRSYFGGSNIATLVEELSAFGTREFILWGYCGGINNRLKIGDMILVRGALREDGVSYHYLEGQEDIIYSDWADVWLVLARERDLREGIIWSCDAMYRETADKLVRYRQRGIFAVEMEVASFYAVCSFKGLKGVAFLVVSDLFLDGTWKGGFHAGAFKKGVKKMTDFMIEKGMR